MDLSFRLLNNWPKDGEGNPVFKCTQDAVLYAGLIFKKNDECWNMLSLRALTVMKVHISNYMTNPDLDKFMKLAFEAQLYRECLEEIRRLRINARDM